MEEPPYFEDEEFERQDYTKNRLPKGDYENCIFRNCNFSDGYLDNTQFLECHFDGCNLSNANLSHTLFKETRFTRCKMLGLHFEDCNNFFFSVGFKESALDLCSFRGLMMKGVVFDTCRLWQTDFTETNLKAASFQACDMKDAVFDRTILEKSDFRTATNFQIDPDNNRIRGAHFSPDQLPSLLSKYKIKID